MSTGYYPTYYETEATDPEWHDWLVNVEGHTDADGPHDLATITDVCASARCKATLYDEQGFVRGHVDECGDYRLES